MKTGLLLRAGAVALTLGGCSTVPDVPPHPLTAETWHLASVTNSSGQTVRLTPEQSERHSARFDTDGRLALQLDCNRGTADWTASLPAQGSGIMTIGPVASTRALCPPPSFGEDLAADLPSATGYTILPGGSELTIITRHVVFGFTADD